jgi:hypothetical protein
MKEANQKLKEDVLAILSVKNKSMNWRLRLIAARVSGTHRRKNARKEGKRRKPKNSHRNRGFAIEEMSKLSERDFTRMFRIDRATFVELVEILDPHLRRNEEQAMRSSGSVIPTETRLAATLRWLAGGNYIDICFAWGVGKSTFFSERGVLWPTIEALDQILDLGFPLNDLEALQS